MNNFKKDTEYLDELLENTTNFIELLADKPNELEDLNPLLAHINIVKALDKIIPMLKHLLVKSGAIFVE